MHAAAQRCVLRLRLRRAAGSPVFAATDCSVIARGRRDSPCSSIAQQLTCVQASTSVSCVLDTVQLSPGFSGHWVHDPMGIP